MLQKIWIELIAIQSILMSVIAPSDLSSITKKFYQLTRKEIDQLLPLIHKQYPDFEERLRYIAEMRIGTPYEVKALGEGSGIEPMPVFRIDKTNCTAFVLTNMALAGAYNYHQAESLMTHLNYYPVPKGKNPISYQNRCHFTSDRLLTSKYFKLITTAIATDGELDTVRLVLNRQSDGSHFLPIDWEKEIQLPYIPRALVTKKLLKKLPQVTGVGIIQKQLFKRGIIIAHEGIVLNGKDFIHASRFSQKVVREDFYRYIQKNKRGTGNPVCDGLVFYLMTSF